MTGATRSRILGIDPGMEGAYALIDDNRLLHTDDLPIVGTGARRRVSGALFHAIALRLAPDVAVIEEVASMPRQGVASTFRFGRAVGTIEGVLAMLPLKMVTPAIWKKHFSIPGKLDGGAERSRQLAIERFPDQAELFARKKDHNRAEAALIALWLFETRLGSGKH